MRLSRSVHVRRKPSVPHARELGFHAPAMECTGVDRAVFVAVVAEQDPDKAAAIGVDDGASPLKTLLHVTREGEGRLRSADLRRQRFDQRRRRVRRAVRHTKLAATSLSVGEHMLAILGGAKNSASARVSTWKKSRS